MVHRFFAVLFFCSLLSSSALSEERGLVQCDAGMSKVPAWTSPEIYRNVIDYLNCGQLVSVVGLERGYVRIQMGEIIAYVDARYVRVAQRNEQPAQTTAPATQESRPNNRRVVQSHSGRSSDSSERPPRFNISGMFTWAHDFNSIESADYLGWDATFVGGITEHFAVEAGASGNYWLSPVSFVTQRYHSFAGGVRFPFAPAGRVNPYVHFLVGFARGTAGVSGLGSASLNFLLLSPGFGMDVNINRHLAIRAFQADWVPMHHELTGWLNTSMRLGAGFVAKF